MGGTLGGKVCIITGGAGSVGTATARLFLAEGASVMLVDLKADDLGRVAAALDNPRVAVCAADVTRADNVAGYVAATLERFGKIDVLFSNAGTFGVVAPIEQYPEDVFNAVYAVHVRGAFLAAKHVVPVMTEGAASSSLQASPQRAAIPASMPTLPPSMHRSG
jgi:NAD(P)-dependent dehydrogenase (short-subunit alcohol dehydrogenase family)